MRPPQVGTVDELTGPALAWQGPGARQKKAPPPIYTNNLELVFGYYNRNLYIEHNSRTILKPLLAHLDRYAGSRMRKNRLTLLAIRLI
jgi:hypothetical protein